MNIKKNNIIIFGAYGFLGNHLSKSLSSKYNVYRQGRGPDSQIKTDLLDCNKILDILHKIKPICVINLIAETNVDLCESNPETAFIANSLIPKKLSKAVSKYSDKLRFIHFSTDQLYNSKNFLDNHEDNPNLINVYSITKYLGEREIVCNNKIILRTNFIGFSNYTNIKKLSFVDWVINKSVSKIKSTLFDDVFISPLHINSISFYLENFIIQSTITGTFNFGSNNGFSKSDIATKILNEINLDSSNFKIGKLNELKLSAKRPNDMRMNLNKIENKFKFKLPDLNEEIKKIGYDYDKLKK